ncbi:MAG: hypothetical protein E7470_05670 [Ruminococcaceae bacterium]|nr:hypothetical protein [Oscillospiraceae bacterium]
MGRFLQVAAGIFVAVILGIIVSKQSKDISLLLSIGACCMALAVLSWYLDPILDLIARLERIGFMQQEWISVILKAIGIGLLVEIGSLICVDAGNAALGKTLQIIGTVVILWLAVPLMAQLLDLLERVLGEV